MLTDGVVKSGFDNWARLAVVEDDQALTYMELVRHGRALAVQLGTMCSTPNTPIAIRCNTVINRSIAVLGVLEAGLTCLLLDPGLPETRLKTILEHSSPGAIIGDQGRPGFWRSTFLDLREKSVVGAASFTPPARDPGSWAYIVYTSGSTGRPKAVCMSHRAIMNVVNWQATFSRASPRTLQLASPGFDVFFQEIFSTWCSGGTLIGLGQASRSKPRDVLRLIAERSVERIFIPPVMLELLAEESVQSGYPVPSLTEVHVAGEQLRISSAIRALFDSNPQCCLVNQYGPSETHVVTFYRLTGAPDSWPDLPPIGRPLPSVELYIDSANSDRKEEQVGELWIGGVSLANGYLNNPEETRERFVSPVPKAPIMYRSGDLVRFGFDDQLAFVGRVDDQTKIHGYRVELGEVMTILSRHPGINQAAVIVSGDDPVSRHLVGFVTPDGTGNLSGSSVRQHLSRLLPRYMVPRRVIVLDSLPTFLNGKLNLPELRRMACAPDQSTRSCMPEDLGPTFRHVAQVWSDVIGTSPGKFDCLNVSGGSSLDAVRIIGRLKEAFGIEVDMAVIMHATVGDIVTEIDRLQKSKGGRRHNRALPHPRPPLSDVVSEMNSRVSLLQDAVWAHQFMYPDSSLLNVSFGIELSESTDTDQQILSRMKRIMADQEVLRTRFRAQHGYLVTSEVIPAGDATLEQKYLEDPNLMQGRYALGETEFLTQPFNLSSDLPIRFALSTVEGKRVVLICLHHIVCDGTSLSVLWQGLGERASRNSSLSAGASKYAEFAGAHRSAFAAGDYDSIIDYWSRCLAKAPITSTWGKRPTSHPHRLHKARRLGTLQERVVRGLRAISGQTGVSVFVVGLAGLCLALSSDNRQEEILVGIPVSLRDRQRWEGVVGLFVNILPVRLEIRGNEPVGVFLARVRESVYQTFRNRHVPLHKLIEAVRPARPIGGSPWFQVTFQLDEELSYGSFQRWNRGISARPILGRNPTVFDISVGLYGPGLSRTWIDYDPDLHPAADMEELANRLNRVWGQLAERGPVEKVERVLSTVS